MTVEEWIKYPEPISPQVANKWLREHGRSLVYYAEEYESFWGKEFDINNIMSNEVFGLLGY